MRIPCGNALRAAIVVLLAAGVARARAEGDDDWLERSRGIMEHSVEQPAPQWLRREATQEALAAAEALVADHLPSAAERGEDPRPGGGARIVIFGSLTIPKETLRALLEDATEPDVVFVLRGVPQGASIPQTVARLRKIIGRTERPPNVIIDPILFRRYAVEAVPTLAMERGDGRPTVLAEGAVTVAWFRRMASTVGPGQERLGHRAETYAIEEKDLVLEIQQRMAKVDWAAQRARALDEFWKRPQTFVTLPEARERRRYFVDPSVQVTEDLRDSEGMLLVRAGESFNPLEWVGLSKLIIIFQGTDPRQVAVAARAAQEAQAAGRGIIFLTTAVDTGRGWAHLTDLESAVKGSVYLLPPLLAERFHLEHVPATVASEGKRLLVTELPVGGPP